MSEISSVKFLLVCTLLFFWVGLTFEKESFAKRKSSLHRDFRKIGRFRYKVKKEWVDKVMQNPMVYASTIQVISHSMKKKGIGAKIVKLKRGSLLSQLGLRKGDFLYRINGQTFEIGPILWLVARYDSIQKVELVLFRKKRKITLQYWIQKARKKALKKKKKSIKK